MSGVNKAALIGACLCNIDAASKGFSVHVSVILNRSTDASLDVIKSIDPSHSVLSVDTVEVADKANALNCFCTGCEPGPDYIAVSMIIPSWQKTFAGSTQYTYAEQETAPCRSLPSVHTISIPQQLPDDGMVPAHTARHPTS